MIQNTVIQKGTSEHCLKKKCTVTHVSNKVSEIIEGQETGDFGCRQKEHNQSKGVVWYEREKI